MALSDQSDDDDGIMMNGGGSRRKSSSFRTKKAEGLYSEENVKKRTSSDGCVKPVTAPKLLPDGTYARPSGRQRKGCDWDGVRGVWVPVESAGDQHDESIDDGGASPAKTEEEDEVDSEIVDEDEEEEEEEVEEEIEIKHPKKKNRKLNPDKDVVQLFAFDDPLKEITMDTGRGRPKRKLKAVARFDSQIFNTKQTSNCKAGEGFPCPRCSNVCSYDSRSCQECSLECYYEAGVGVVVLKERNVSVSPKKRSKTATPAKKASTAFNAGGGSTTKKKGNERTTSSRGSSAKKNERKAPQPEGKGNKERQSPKPRKKNARKAQKEPTGKEKEDQEEEEEEERPTAAVSKSTRETQPVDQREEKGDKQTNATHSASDGESSEKTQPIVREEEQLTKPVVGKEKDNAKEEAVGEKSDDDVSSAADSTNLGGEKTDAAAEEEEAGGDEHAIEEEEVPTVVMMDNSATNTGESTQPMLGGKEEAHHIENKTTSSARKKMEGVYSEENVKKRTSADGCVKPVTAPKLLPDGTYACPSGRQRKGCNWDGVRGVWVPSEHTDIQDQQAEKQDEGEDMEETGEEEQYSKEEEVPTMVMMDSATNSASETPSDAANMATESSTPSEDGPTKHPPPSIPMGSKGKHLPQVPAKKASKAKAAKSIRARGRKLPTNGYARVVTHKSKVSQGSPASAKSTTNVKSSDERDRDRKVVSLYEKRPFVIGQYSSPDEARKDLGVSCKVIRERKKYNHENGHPKNRAKGKYLHYDFRHVDDSKTARRWQCELLAMQHADFVGCDNLSDGKENPSWFTHLANAHYRMRMGRRILNFFRANCTTTSTENVATRLFEGHGTMETEPINPPPRGFTPLKKSASLDSIDDEDVAAKNAIIAAIRGRASSSPTNQHVSFHHSLDHSLEAGHLTDHSLAGSVGGNHRTDLSLGTFNGDHSLPHSEDHEHEMSMVDELNKDFPPEDYPPDIADNMSGGGGKLDDLASRVIEMREEKKDIQAKYDSLLSSSMKTEEELRSTISTLKSQIRAGTAAKLSSNKSEEFTNITKSDDLAPELNDSEKKNALLSSKISELTTQLTTSSAEGVQLTTKLSSTTNDLSVAWEKIETLAIKVTQLETSIESLTMQRDAANTRAQELLEGNDNVGGALSSIMSERNQLASSIEEIKDELTSMETEKAKAVSKAMRLETTVEELQGRVEALSAELNTSKLSDESDQSHIVEKEAEYKQTIADLEEGNRRQKDEAQTSNVTANTQIADLEGQVSQLKAERDELTTKIEESNAKVQEDKSDQSQEVAVADIAAKYKRTIADLEGRNESLSAELNASKLSDKSDQSQIVDADLEAKYKRKIDDVEERNKRQKDEAQTLSVSVADLEGQVSQLSAERDDLATKMEEASADLSKWQSTYETLTTERDAANAKVKELLDGNAKSDEAMDALNSEKEVLISKIEECISRLYLEKDDTAVMPIDPPSPTLNDSFNSTNPDQDQMAIQMRARDAEVSKLVKDKEKLEEYTKQTLGIFQQKYINTTQEYKAQLKEKIRQIQALESELAKRLPEQAEAPVGLQVEYTQSSQNSLSQVSHQQLHQTNAAYPV